MKLKFDSKTFARQLRQKRLIDLDIKLDEVVKLTGVSKPTLSRIERGYKPDLVTYANLCDWLGVPMNHFVKNGKK